MSGLRVFMPIARWVAIFVGSSVSFLSIRADDAYVEGEI